MPEPDDGGQNPEDKTPDNGPPKDDKTDDEPLREPGKKALAEEREARTAAEKRAADLEKKVREFEDRDKTDDEKKDARIKELEQLLAERDTELTKSKVEQTRRDVASETNVPVDLIKGKTREEMEASAKKALDWRGTGSKKPPGGPLRSGASNTDDAATKKERAALALRGLGSNR